MSFSDMHQDMIIPESAQPRALRVFIESGGALAGTLTVKAKAQQGAPLIFEAPITVGQGL
ncbi:MAG: hypothetical protein IT375_12230 [Polyangiaceae bacterium]|nr:hypothetical protein [Polyangiaceae bacterium]